MSEYSIKQATIGDLNQVADLFEQYRLFYQKQPDPKGAHQFIAQRLEKQDSTILLATNDQQALGFVQLYPSFSSTSMQLMYILNDLFVAPAARKQQVGKALMNAASDFGRTQQAHSLKLCTAIDNFTAQSLYQQLGYKKIEQFEHYSLML